MKSARRFIVIPCHNEELRLNFNILSDYCKKLNATILFVNDSSNDATEYLIKEFITMSKKSKHLILNNIENFGKGESLRIAFEFLIKNFYNSDGICIGIMDADTPFALEDLLKAFALADKYQNYCLISGARVNLAGNDVNRTRIRSWAGRAIASMVSSLLRIKIYDPQSPCKVFNIRNNRFNHFNLISQISNNCKTRWFGDAELIMRFEIKNDEILEFPVVKWQDVAGSHFNFLSIFVVLIDLITLYLLAIRFRFNLFNNRHNSGIQHT